MKRKPLALTQRDSDLLVDLYKHRFLSISQIQRLHFPSLQTTYRRMRVLREEGLVVAFSVANIHESIFAIGAKGLQAVAAAIGVETSELKWQETASKPKDYYFMQHFLSINDFRILLRKACLRTGIRLLGFIPDYYGKRTESGTTAKYIKDLIFDKANGGHSVSHTPDAVFALERNGKAALFFLEIDRGTETVSDPTIGVLKAFRFYNTYFAEGVYQRYAKDFDVVLFKGFRVLFVTTTEARTKNIRRAGDKLDAGQKTKQFFWITDISKLNSETLFEGIWRSLDSRDDSIYQIVRST